MRWLEQLQAWFCDFFFAAAPVPARIKRVSTYRLPNRTNG
jgi:hypothetical protein